MFINDFPAEYLRARIQAVRALVDTPVVANSEAADLILEVAQEARRVVSFAELDRRLSATARIDVGSIERAVELMRGIAPEHFSQKLPADWGFDREKQLHYLAALLEGLEHHEELDRMEVLLRLSMAGDSTFDQLLMVLVPGHEAAGKLLEMIRSKVQLLDDERLIELYGEFQSEIRLFSRWGANVPLWLLDAGSPTDLRDKISRYLVEVRPRVEWEVLQSGTRGLPIVPIGIARVLSWNDSEAGAEVGPAERAVARAIARIGLGYEHLSDSDGPEYGTLSALARAFGLPEKGYLLGGGGRSLAKRKCPPASAVSTLNDLVLFVSLIEHMGVRESTAEKALRAYKLGLEVMAQDLRNTLKKYNEVRLQRELCRFLVERHIWAAGTKFGQNQADVRVEDRFETYWVETKKVTSPPSDRELKTWATQLLSYLDQAPMKKCGVLALYNLTDTAICAPDRFLRGRLLVLPINLGDSASNRDTSIVVQEPEQPGELFNLVHLRSGAQHRGTSKTKPRARGKR